MAVKNVKGTRISISPAALGEDEWAKRHYGDSADDAQRWTDIGSGKTRVEIKRGEQSFEVPLDPPE